MSLFCAATFHQLASQEVNSGDTKWDNKAATALGEGQWVLWCRVTAVTAAEVGLCRKVVARAREVTHILILILILILTYTSQAAH